MGNAATKLRKALQAGDEALALQLYYNNAQMAHALDPNSSYGDTYSHNTPMHYTACHAMVRLLSVFLKEKEGNPNKRNSHEETALHCSCMPSTLILQPLHVREDRSFLCLRLMLDWQGALLNPGERERAKVDARDNRGNTPLHYAAAAGMKRCMELLVQRGASLYAENKEKFTPCDCAEHYHHYEVALYLESRMVLSDERSSEDESESEACLFAGKQEVYEGLRIQDLQELKDQIIVQTADMLQVPLFTAEALLRSRGWDREHLLEAWMTDSVACCQRAGVQLPPPPPTGQNSWGTIPDLSPMNSPMTPPLEFDDGLNQTCEICFGWLPRLCGLVDIPCGHCFCRACWEAYLNVKIKEGETDNILCPAYDCYQLVPVEVIEGLISREMARRYLQFDIKAFVESNPTIRWCPVPGCDRAVQLSGPTTNMAGILPSQLLRAPAVDCGNGHTFCW